jgi:catechol 2,3-dioxygenase-like lactoylglutathione lyase family enzyme
LETAAVSTSTIPTALRRADHVCIGVDDFEGVLAWYCEKLGFAVEKRWHVEKLPGVQLAYLIGPDGFRLEVLGGGQGPRSPIGADFAEHLGIRGWNHLCFWSDDVDATMADLAAWVVGAFVPVTDYPIGAERRVAFVQDPEGNVIEFAGPLSGGRT